MKLSEVLPQEQKTVKLSQVLSQSEPVTEKTMYVPETDRVIGYPSDRNYDEIRFDVETSELKKDPGGFFGTVEIANEAAIGVFKGLGQFAAQQVPQAIAGLAEERLATMADRKLPDLFQEVVSANPLVSSKAAVDLAFKAVFGQERLEEQSEAAIRLTDRLIEKTNEIEALKTEGKAQEVGAAIGSGVASLAASLGLFALTKDATASTLLFGGMAKGDATTRARLAGKTVEEREKISSLVGIGEGVLEYAGLNLWTKWVRGSGAVANALRIGGRATSEGLQELSQELSSQTILKLSGVSNDDWAQIWKQAAYAGAIGLLVGGGVATMVNFTESKNPAIAPLREAGLNDAEIEQVYEAIAKKAKARVMPELEAAVTKEMMDADKGIQKAKTEQEAKKQAEPTRTTEEAGKTQPQPEKGTKKGIPAAVPTTKAAQKPISTPGAKKVKSSAYQKMLERAKGDAKKLKNITDVLDALEKLEGDSSIYTQMNIAEQAALGIQYVEENLSSAKRITQGIEPPPPGVTRAAISIAYAQKMKELGNINEWLAAEKTRMLQQRRLGQEIVMERGRVDEHSPEHFISQLIDARMAMAGRKMFGQPTFKKETTIKRGEAKIQQEAEALSKTLTKQELDIMEAQKIIDGIIC